MKVLLTGGAGYIGSVLTRSLLAEGHEVRVLDTMLYQNRVSPRSGLEVIVGSISDQKLLRKASVGVDLIIHLAAIVGDEACNLDTERTFQTNYVSTEDVARVASGSRIPLIFFSTCSVYGSSPNSVLSEEGTVGPLSLYARLKLAAEHRLSDIHDRCLILRLGTVFGLSPRMRFDLVVNRLVGQAVLDGRISLFGGEQYRPFIHVKDVVSNVLKAIERETRGLYNLGGENFSIGEVGQKVKDATGCVMTVYPKNTDPRNYAVDSGKAKSTFGAIFPTKIEDAIQEITECFHEGTISSYSEAVYNNVEWLRLSNKAEWLKVPA